MTWALGVAFFFLCILVSVALHECGHMWVARATGMKVRRYFVGFGPTLWSTNRSNRLGTTEYGVKAVPLGGFCDIAGMTPVEDLTPDEEPHAMYKQKAWKRVAVLFAGPGMNFVVGLVLVYGIALIWGLPDLHPPTTPIVGQTACVASEVTKGKFGDCVGPEGGPAARAGMKPGDTIVKVGDKFVTTTTDAVAAIQSLHGPTTIVVEREGQLLPLTVDITSTQRFTKDSGDHPASVGAIGISVSTPDVGLARHNPLSAVPATFAFTGDLAVELGKAVAKIPSKIGALVDAIAGGERDPETPISIVGASIIGGDTVAHGVWIAFWFTLAQLNFVLGALNLIPLLPFDGGHIAIALYEKLRNVVRNARGLVPAAPINYYKLMPATYVVLIVVGGFSLLAITADVVNPIRPFQ